MTASDHPDAYVRRIVTTSYLDWRRRPGSGDEPVGVVPDAASGSDLADAVVRRDELRRALRTLTPHQRAVLVLRHYEGYDDAAIAAVLNCGEGTVRTHASRGAERLRRALGSTDMPRRS